MGKKIFAAVLALSVLLCTLTSCGKQTFSDTGVKPQTERTDQTVQADVQPLKGIYETVISDPDDDFSARRLELMERGDSLLFRFIQVYDGFTVPFEVNEAVLEGDADGFTAEYSGYLEHITISGDRNSVDVKYDINGELSSEHFEPESPHPTERVFPTAETDPLSPNGAIEKHLAAAAREYLGLPSDAPLTAEDCAMVEQLDLFESGIASLQGIEYFTSLKSLSVSGGYLKDISALSGIHTLERISVSWCYVEEIPDLSGCERLEIFEAAGCCVDNIGNLAGIPSLKWLNLCDNNITSVAPIKDMEGLESVDLSFNPITDWDCIRHNESLQAALDWDYQMALDEQEKAREIIAQVITGDMTDLQKQIALCEKIHELADSEVVYRGPEPNGYEVIMHGKGVCGDYAQAASLLMNMAGLHVINCGSDTHEWNMIELDGEWYEFDCLWDDNTPQENWTYFNLGHKEMAAIPDHNSDPLRYPDAVNSMMTLEYYPFSN